MDLFSDDEAASGSKARQNHRRSPPNDGIAITINEDYANRFQHNHERAELHRLQEKYGPAAASILAGRRRDDDDDEDEDEDSSDDETEDEEGEQVTAEVDAAILRTLAKIRSGDASIYDSDKRVFDEEKAMAATSAMLPKGTRSKVEKKVTLADYQRNRLRDLMATSDDPALALANATAFQRRADEATGTNSEPLSHNQEQEKLRKQVTQAFHEMDADEEEDGFFTKRKMDGDSDEEGGAESYKRYLLESLGNAKSRKAVREALRTPQEMFASVPQASSSKSEAPSSSKPKKRKQQDPQANEEFLMNYILNRGWMDNPDAAPRASRHRRDSPDVEEDKDDGGGSATKTASGERDWDAEAAELESEASFDSRADAFEQAFNFRYEAMEAGDAPAQVQSYARNTQNSVRRTEDKRKKEREDRKKRKEQEKRQRMEEIDRMRDLQKSQLREKIKQLHEAAGSQKIDFDPLSLEGDFDESKHEAMMAVFGDKYYDDKDEDDDVKPTWDDDIDIADILAEEQHEEDEAEGSSRKKSKKDKKKARQANADDDDVIEMDADFVDAEDAGIDTSKLSKKDRKKLKKKLKAQANKNSLGDEEMPDGVDADAMDAETETRTMPQTAEERKAAAKKLADEYRNLEYEDVIGGDLATRFHYTQVPKTSYGLSAVEILLADDKDLNDVVALKHFQPYRRGGDKRPRDLNRRVKELRRKLDEAEGDGSEQRDRKKRKSSSSNGVDGQNVKKPKRLGKKERQKAAKAAEEAEAVDDAAAPVEIKAESKQDGAQETEEERTRRRKEKKERKRAEKKAALLAEPIA